MKKLISLLLSLVLVLSLFSGMTITASAENQVGTPTGYTSASQVVYDTSGAYLKNWGARGETATFLTTYALNYYTGNYSYASLSANSGSSNSSSYTSSALYNALHSMLAAKQTTTTSYDGTRDMFCYTDCVNNNSTYISSFYSAARVSGAWDSGSTWNREHTWPQSKSTGEQKNDIMMLRPTAVSENSSRGNKAYGESSSCFNPNTYAGSLGLDLRGDCARIMLYCYVRWSENAGNMWGVDGAIESLELLLNWMEADPVDTWEMGRNDSVQSITGVRNCFVDYPELAWLLFGQQVPANYTSPSSGSSNPTYTVTATSNNANYGTVSVDGCVITASPKTGYYAAGYTVTSGSATVTQDGNTFTVNPASDCTVRIDFAAKTPVTITYMANGSVYSTVTGYAGEDVILSETATSVTDWTFSGWAEATIAETTVKPAYYAPGVTYTPTADVTFYAVYTQSSGGTSASNQYARFTGDLEAGDYLVVYNGKAMKAAETSNGRLDYENVTVSDNVITTDNAALVWSLTSESISGTTYWRFYNADANGYAAATSTNNRATLLSAVNDYARWSVTASSGTYDFLNKANSRYLRNNGTYGFAAYSSSTGGPLSLYQNVSTTTVTYTTEPAGADYTVTFTTPDGITAPAAMTINSRTGAELPTADSPDGYTFLGWVTKDYDNVDVMPSTILTGLYKPKANITLKALYSYVDDSQSGPQLVLMSVNDTFSDGDRIVITAAGTNHGLYRETYNRTYASDFDFTNDAEAILADPKTYFPVTQVDGGWWLGDNDNGYLYTPDNQVNLTIRTYNESFMTAFTLTTYDGHLALLHTVSYNTNQFYLKCGTDFSGSIQNKWRMINLANGATATGVVTLDIYKLTEGEPAVTRYTTIINVHVHTPGSPVTENNLEPTCTAAGSYDTVVYCTECGEELSRETVTVPALGHLPADAVQENYVEPTATMEGGYDMVVYCQRCSAELSREHTTLPATRTGYYLIGPDWTVDAIVEDNLFVENTSNPGEFMLTTTLAVGDQIKVVHVTNNVIDGWFPESTGNEYTVDAAHAGEKTVYFKTTYQNDWAAFGGYIWIAAEEPSTELDLVINNTLALEGATTLNYFVSKDALDAYELDSFKLVVVHTAFVDGEYVDETVELEVKDELYGNGAYYWFEYKDIAAKELNDKMVAHVEGVKGELTFTSQEKDYNPMTYCYTIAQRPTANAALRQTCADMIKYAAAAQICFSYNTANPADADWNDDIAAVATQGEPALENFKEIIDLEGQTVEIKTYTLDASGRVNINYYVLPDSGVDYTTLTLVCTYKDVKGNDVTTEIPGSDWSFFNATYGYMATLNTVNAGEMREIITAVVKDANGNVVSNTYKTSIETYAWHVSNNSSNTALINLMKAMLNYGTSAQAFLA